MGSVRTSILGGPRPLSSDRRAQPDYTLSCEEPYIFAVESDKSLSGMAWSDSQRAYFVYVPELRPNSKSSLTINFGVDLTAFALNVRVWSKAASALRDVCGSVTVAGRGIAGEEQREYEVVYQFGSAA